ncbi:S8 family peptidase [Sporomusa sp. KB1]|uniref:S8 family peptidase n=1 Tax=Sporomusa sp. KB1 TaxID=943346 RepID=UPI001C9788F2|nr:S8 family peptidase [Sporomusa sp. KB1]
MAKKTHIFLQDQQETIKFRAPGGGSEEIQLPRRNRVDHAAFLRRRLTEAWNQASVIMTQRKAVSLPTRQGVYLQFRGAPGNKLPVTSLEQIRSGIRLLNVQYEGEPGQEVTTATVYIPDGKQELFLKKIAKYEKENTPKKGEPYHENLFAPLDDIRYAILESFWLDLPESIPTDDPIWCEAWLQGNSLEITESIFVMAEVFGILVNKNEILHFPERQVVLIKANRQQLVELIEGSSYIAEFRKARDTARFFEELENVEQSDWVNELLSRLQFNDSDVSICILDTGVNNGHPLLAPVIDDCDCHTFNPNWGRDDQRGHGTRMAGLAAYGDLRCILEGSSPVEVRHRIESVKILPSGGSNDPDLYGYITQQAASLTEISNPTRRRISCMAVTTSEGILTGRPSSWSGAIDALTSGYHDQHKRLFIVSAGTIPEAHWGDYPRINLKYPVEDPGQSWNALTVGAYTQKDNVTDLRYGPLTPIASANQLSPSSTTSVTWEERWPIKPDVVFEGGNGVRDQSGFPSGCDDLSLITTYFKPHQRHLSVFWGTSAATAEASHLAAQIQCEYPNMWPETVRGIIVHSAEWTSQMEAQFLDGRSRADYRKLMRIVGYGVPNVNRCLECSRHRLTLIAQEEMQPFEKSPKGTYRAKDMHIYKLPWPTEVLRGLGETLITMKVTLSYFVEPAPGEIGWGDRYRYSSYGLRFDINSPLESKDQFLVRLNAAVRDDGEKVETSSRSDRWNIGQTSDLGSIHSDFWKGTAAEIAECNLIGIYPVSGWWKLRPHLGKYEQRARYSLIVSLQTPDIETDIYTPIVTPIIVPVS